MQSVAWLAAAPDVGGYISILKVIPLLLLLVLWGRLLTWADKDTEAAHLPRELLNTILFAAALVAFGAFFFIPSTLIAYGVLVFIMLASAGTYLFLRNQQVGLKDLRKELKNAFGGSGKKAKKETRPGEVQLFTKGGNPIIAPEPEDPVRAGYDAAQEFLTVPLRRGAERVEVRPGAEGGAAGVQYVVDGMPYSAPAMDRVAAAAGVTFLKKSAGLDVEDRRKPQTGTVKATLDNTRHDLEVMTAGTTAGESMRVTVDPRKRFAIKLEEMGLTPEQLAAAQAFVANPTGIVLVAAPRQQGLTAMLYAILRAHDAFLSHIHTIEHGPKEDLEGITQNKLATNVTPVDELKQVQWVTSQQPDIIMMDEIANPASAQELLRFAAEGRRVYVALRAGGTFEAISAWCKLIGDPAAAVAPLNAVIAGRVLRRLCQACKVAYEPDRETLRKLNMDPGRVTTLYQARTQPLRDAKGNPIGCTFCHDLAYKGRFGIYEVFTIDDDARSAITGGGSINQLKTAFRKQRGWYLQEVALAHVEAGETSVQEIVRVLKGADQSSAAKR